jgi:C_GCAxxG_C_C family probable redox protein
LVKPEYERAAQKARDLFLSGYNCAESVLLSTLELMGEEAEWAPRVASGFGGGIGRTCQVCGAITGAVIASGWARGRESAGDGIDELYSIVSSLVDDFVERFGTSSCGMLIDVDLADPEQRARAQKDGVFAEQCTKFVEFCTLTVAEKLGL